MKTILTITLAFLSSLVFANSPAYDVAVTNLERIVSSDHPDYSSAFRDLRTIYLENRAYSVPSNFLASMELNYPYTNKQQRISVHHLILNKTVEPTDFTISELIDWIFEPTEYTETYIEPERIVSALKRTVRREVLSKHTGDGKSIKSGIREMNEVFRSPGFIGLEELLKKLELGTFDCSKSRTALESLVEEFKTHHDDRHLFRLRFILTESDYLRLKMGL